MYYIILECHIVYDKWMLTNSVLFYYGKSAKESYCLCFIMKACRGISCHMCAGWMVYGRWHLV